MINRIDKIAGLSLYDVTSVSVPNYLWCLPIFRIVFIKSVFEYVNVIRHKKSSVPNFS